MGVPNLTLEQWQRRVRRLEGAQGDDLRDDARIRRARSYAKRRVRELGAAQSSGSDS
jgi:hypothetical protein